jgi:dihydropteroate synthase
MTRTRSNWKVRDHVFTIGERTLLMGVVNVTPDSFSDGGRFLDADAAAAHAMLLEQQGADIIDIGAESTRPGSERINAGEELRRLIPVLKRLKNQLSIPISVDTYKAEVAEKALEHGASIINDVSALTWEPDLVKTIVKYDAGLILSHMRGTPETWARLGPMKDVMGTLVAELEAAVHRATRAGVARDRIVIDPGIGFGKRGEQNSEILARLGELGRLLLPILVAASRKNFLSQEDPASLDYATAAAVTTAILNGAAIVRVHNVAAMKPVVQTADAIIEATPEREERPRVKPKSEETDEEKRRRPVRPVPQAKPVERPEPIRAEPKPVEQKPQERPRRPFERRTDFPDQRPPERKPYERRSDDRRPDDRPKPPFRRRDDDSAGRPEERRPYQRSSRPADSGGDKRDKKPYERRDQPFRRRDDQSGGDRPRGPFQRSSGKGDDRPESRPYEKRGPKFGSGADKRDDRPGSKRPFPPRGDDRPGSKRPFPPRGDDRPSGGGRPPRPFGPKRTGGGGPPKRSGGPSRGGPKKRS